MVLCQRLNDLGEHGDTRCTDPKWGGEDEGRPTVTHVRFAGRGL